MLALTKIPLFKSAPLMFAAATFGWATQVDARVEPGLRVRCDQGGQPRSKGSISPHQRRVVRVFEARTRFLENISNSVDLARTTDDYGRP